jgi:serine/threonine protein kinase
MEAHGYKKDHKVGEGTYGLVYRGIDNSKIFMLLFSSISGNGAVVALKKIRMGNINDGVSFTAIREIKVLREINHPNVVPVRKFSKYYSHLTISF